MDDEIELLDRVIEHSLERSSNSRRSVVFLGGCTWIDENTVLSEDSAHVVDVPLFEGPELRLRCICVLLAVLPAWSCPLLA